MEHFAVGCLGVFFFLGSVNGQCEPCDLSSVPEGFEKVTFTLSNEHVINPSRGFMQYITTSASDFSPLSVSRLEQYREEDGITLAWRQYVLDLYVDDDIPQSFIDLVHADMQVLRDAKFTTVVRFMYTIVMTDGAPYGDADKQWMLTHISQLRPVFFDNGDVIDVVQAGMIGTWGEWYYTTHFGDPDYLDWSDPDNVRGMTPENWQDRGDVLNAMLDNVPQTMHVQARVPQYKQMIHDDWTPTTEQEMQQRTHKARTGHYNDCFLASSTDMGTYINKSAEYPYMQDDCLYTWMGGETCRISEEPDRHRCPTAVLEMSELHFTYLNQAYNQEVLDVWKEEGCFDDIHRNMGYRLQLTEAVFPTDGLAPGSKLCFRIEFDNNGYAGLFRERTVALLLKNQANDDLLTVDLPGYDVRKWLPGSKVIIEDVVGIPDDVTSGTYQVLLAIKHPSLHQYSDYNILLANRNVPQYTEGLNYLSDIEITSGSDNSGDDCPQLEPTTGQDPSSYDRLYCGLGGCEQEPSLPRQPFRKSFQSIAEFLLKLQQNTKLDIIAGLETVVDALKFKHTESDDSVCVPYTVDNPSFETDEAWQGYGEGFEYTSEAASDGARSARVENGGVHQVWSFPSGTRSFQVTADSSNQGIDGSESNDYSVYCDVRFADDSWSYGHAEPFDVDNTAWHTVNLIVNHNQDISEAWCYGMFRNYNSGVAFFDNFRVWTSTEELVDSCL